MADLNFKITSISKDGTVVTLINGKQYTYYVDHAVALRAWRMCRYQPGKALAILKKKARSYTKP